MWHKPRLCINLHFSPVQVKNRDNACNTRRVEGVVRKHTVAYVTDPEPTPQRSRIGVITIFRISL